MCLNREDFVGMGYLCAICLCAFQLQSGQALSAAAAAMLGSGQWKVQHIQSNSVELTLKCQLFRGAIKYVLLHF
jgi:hypothetical protein